MQTAEAPSLTDTQSLHQRLVTQLFKSAPVTLWMGLLVGGAVATAVYRTTSGAGIIWWFLTLAVVTLARLAWLRHLNRRLDADRLTVTVRRYTAGALIAGSVWASLIFVDSPAHPLGTRMLLLTVLLGMPVASLSSNAMFKPVFFGFAGPIFLALLVWALWFGPGLKIEFGLLGVAYIALVSTVANRYSDNLSRGIERDLENERLVRELNLANDELQRLAYQDPLTGLSNRRSFEEAAERMLQRLGPNETLALMLIDMDGFKWINDTLGHEAGDRVLIELSRRIDAHSRINEIIVRSTLGAARLGGDEFVVLYHLNADALIEPVAARILEAAMAPMRLVGRDYHPRVSVGIALAPQQAGTLDELLQLADKAMYRSKRDGGGRFTIADPTQPDERSDLPTIVSHE